MHIYHELQLLETVYKRLTNVQKGVFVGFCNDTSRADVPPPLWNDIDSTRIEANLCYILDREWNKNSTNINIQYYKIYWSDDLLTAIRKVEFTELGEAIFLTSELGIRLLQLLP